MMGRKIFRIIALLLVVGSCNARPQRAVTQEFLEKEETRNKNEEGWQPLAVGRSADLSDNVRVNSRAGAANYREDLKNLQYMDQSLRTVATQLLNVTNPDNSIANKSTSNGLLIKASPSASSFPSSSPSSIRQPEKSIIQTTESLKPLLRNPENLENLTKDDGNQETHFGRPVNSKFNFFESSHPGQAMALTEEELEKELGGNKMPQKHLTTTGGISTWILLNPPTTSATTTTTTTSTTTTTTRKPSTSANKGKPGEKKDTLLLEKVQTTLPASMTFEKVATKQPGKNEEPKRTTPAPSPSRKTTTPVAGKEEDKEKLVSTVKSSLLVKNNATSSVTLKPTVTTFRVTSKTTTKGSNPKPVRPNRVKTGNTKRPGTGASTGTTSGTTTITTMKAPTTASMSSTTMRGVSQVEKVTFKPLQMIPAAHITKVKATVTTGSPTTAAIVKGDDFPSDRTPVSSSVVLKSTPARKPLDEVTKIEIEPIKVNAPVLKIERIRPDPTKEPQKLEDPSDDLEHSKIDVTFDFNPGLTRVETASSSTEASSTTKRPKQSTGTTNKRKKNKNRRRKPSRTSSTSSSSINSISISSTSASNLSDPEPTTTPSDLVLADNSIQESKIEPDMNGTKLKKKPTQPKPISTQIYNFLSRDVMPSFGVMSLVGLGLGLASYFLYPFGGTIARRNYELESPNYKYNFDEYGGNFGQSEEEVLSKVFQGMTSKYDQNPGNRYRHQHYEGAYLDPQGGKKPDARFPSSPNPVYERKPLENVATGSVKYRNSDFPTTLPNYYELNRQTYPNGNRQFVVGNIPKEYSPFGKKPASKLEKNDQESEPQSTPSYGYSLQFSESQTLKNEEQQYEEVEITPTAVAVEHGPRSLKVKRSVSEKGTSRMRNARESVIQVIPLKGEKVEEEEEEDLSNEIIDILGSVIDEDKHHKETHHHQHQEKDHAGAQHPVTPKPRDEVEKVHLKDDHTVEVVKIDDKVSHGSSESVKPIEGSDKKQEITSNVSSTTEDLTLHLTEPTEDDDDGTTEDWFSFPTEKPKTPLEEGLNVFNFVKKLAEIKFRLGITILKHASEGFARYLGNVQKRMNGEE